MHVYLLNHCIDIRWMYSQCQLKNERKQNIAVTLLNLFHLFSDFKFIKCQSAFFCKQKFILFDFEIRI